MVNAICIIVRDYTDRRTILRAVGIGVTISVAGCSGDENSPPNAEDSDESTTSDQETSTDSGTQTEQNSGDVVHTGEEDLEEYISTAGDPEDLPDGLSSYTNVGQSEYEWVEFEDIRNQVSFDFGDFGNDDPAGLDERGTLDEVDTFYLALRESSEGYETIWVGLRADEWDEESSAVGNYRNFFEGTQTEESTAALESLFDENVSGYDDVSEDLSQDYIELIEE